MLNEKGIIQLLLILILLVGIVLGVYLVQQRTHILPFAHEDIITAPQSGENSQAINSEINKINELESKSERRDETQLSGDRKVKIPIIVFEDSNKNGVLDGGEVGIPNITVKSKAFYSEVDADNPNIQKRSNFIKSTTTDAHGMAEIEWPAGALYVDRELSKNIKVSLDYADILFEEFDNKIEKFPEPFGWTKSQPYPLSIKFYPTQYPGTIEANPTGDTILETAEFPLIGNQKISGQVFYDNNRNGIRDGDELQSDRVVSGVRILIDATKADNSPQRIYFGVSNSDGTYEIDNLPPLSRYRVKVVPACPYVATVPPKEGLTLGSAGNANYDFGVVYDENDLCVTN